MKENTGEKNIKNKDMKMQTIKKKRKRKKYEQIKRRGNIK